MPFKVIQGHRFWYQSKARVHVPIGDLYFARLLLSLTVNHSDTVFQLTVLCRQYFQEKNLPRR